MKKTMAVLMLLSSAVFSVSAFQDSYADMNSDPLYLDLLDAMKNSKDESLFESAYDAYMASEASAEEKSRAEYQVTRYFMDKGDKESASLHLQKNGEYFDAISPDVPAVRRDIAECERLSAIYYVEGGMMTNGLKSSDKSKELYSKYPDEVYVALNEAYRYLFTPPIAGGSPKKAQRILRELDPEGLSVPDLVSYYIANAVVHSELEEYDRSDDFLKKASAIYRYDPSIESVMKENKRSR